MTINDVMSHQIIWAKLSDSVLECAKKMKEMDVGFLPLVQKDKILGVITDRDIVVRVLSNQGDVNSLIEGYMTKNPISISVQETLEKACLTMAEHKIKRLLVTDRNKVIGILSLSDLFFHVNADILKETVLKIYEVYRNVEELNTSVDAFYL